MHDFASSIRVAVARIDAPLTFAANYSKIYSYQRIKSGGIETVPEIVGMRGSNSAIFTKHSKAGWAIKVFERWLRRSKATVVDCSLPSVFQEVYDSKLAEKFEMRCFYSDKIFYYRRSLRGFVVVNGIKVPMDPERIALLEKSLRVVEKIGALKPLMEAA